MSSSCVLPSPTSTNPPLLVPTPACRHGFNFPVRLFNHFPPPQDDLHVLQSDEKEMSHEETANNILKMRFSLLRSLFNSASCGCVHIYLVTAAARLLLFRGSSSNQAVQVVGQADNVSQTTADTRCVGKSVLSAPVTQQLSVGSQKHNKRSWSVFVYIIFSLYILIVYVFKYSYTLLSCKLHSYHSRNKLYAYIVDSCVERCPSVSLLGNISLNFQKFLESWHIYPLGLPR